MHFQILVRADSVTRASRRSRIRCTCSQAQVPNDDRHRAFARIAALTAVRPIEQQIILVTGATDSLGRAVAGELAGQGATLLLHGRSEERGKRTLSEIRARTGNNKLAYYGADFESLSEVRDLAERIQAEHERLDVLLNNAALGIDPVRRISSDGHESTLQVDYLAPYVLSYLLEPLLIASAPSRIVNVASAGQAPINFHDIMLERSYDGLQAYCQAKLAEIMLTIDQAAQLSGTGVTVNCVHPAFNMPTKIVTHMFTPQSEIADGVRSTLRLIADPALENVTGRYFDETQEARALSQAYDERARARLRGIAEQLTGVPAGRIPDPRRLDIRPNPTAPHRPTSQP
jgi:NAD(P)-dependent dehydrogenase (short-subunit alcohol dehydrogenase family)